MKEKAAEKWLEKVNAIWLIVSIMDSRWWQRVACICASGCALFFTPYPKISIKQRMSLYLICNFHISPTESQKGVNDVPSGNSDRALLPWILYSYSALLELLNGTSLNCINALLALNWRYLGIRFHFVPHLSDKGFANCGHWLECLQMCHTTFKQAHGESWCYFSFECRERRWYLSGVKFKTDHCSYLRGGGPWRTIFDWLWLLKTADKK